MDITTAKKKIGRYKEGETYILPIGTEVYFNGEFIKIDCEIQTQCLYVDYDYYSFTDENMPIFHIRKTID